MCTRTVHAPGDCPITNPILHSLAQFNVQFKYLPIRRVLYYYVPSSAAILSHIHRVCHNKLDQQTWKLRPWLVDTTEHPSPSHALILYCCPMAQHSMTVYIATECDRKGQRSSFPHSSSSSTSSVTASVVAT